MSARHTPGPWSIGDIDREHDEREIVAGRERQTGAGECESIICLVCPVGTDPIDSWDAPTRDANARLIAKAPEMREVIGKLVEWAEYMGGWENPVWDKARTVLAEIDGPAT